MGGSCVAGRGHLRRLGTPCLYQANPLAQLAAACHLTKAYGSLCRCAHRNLAAPLLRAWSRPADAEGRYSAALFVQWVPYQLAGTSWEAEEEGYVRHLLGLLDMFAPGVHARGAA